MKKTSNLLKSLNETEKNYEIYDKEILVVIRELKNWRHMSYAKSICLKNISLWDISC